MKDFDFLITSPFYVKTKDFYYDRYYYFEDSFTKKTAEIRIPFTHKHEIDFNFHKCGFIEETPLWFQVLFLQAKKVLEIRDRVRRLFEETPKCHSSNGHFYWVVSPALEINECQISKEILSSLHEDFSMNDTIKNTKEKLFHYKIQIKQNPSDVKWKTFTPFLSRHNVVALHPLMFNQGGLILKNDTYPKIRLMKR